MSDLTVKRTLVKSPPELWTELSEVESLARHLGELGEIKISRLEPEHTVAWEGENARGVVEIEASGWGTKVTLTAEVEPRPAPADVDVDVDEQAPEPEPEPDLPPAAEWRDSDYLEATDWVEDKPLFVAPERRRRRWRGWLRRRAREERLDAEPETFELDPDTIYADSISEPSPFPIEPESTPAPAPELEAASATESSPESEQVLAVLESALDNLGQAHHRPFSRG